MPTANTIRCAYCGKELEPRTLPGLHGHVNFGWKPCDCPGAVAERERKELDELEKSLQQRVKRAKIPARYREANDPEAKKYADMVAAGKNLYVFGEVGSGKTYLASSIARELLKADKRVLMATMGDILTEIKQSFGTNDDPLSRYRGVEILILDDLGKESSTDFALERLFVLVDERSKNLRPTIVTTNYKPSKLIQRLSKNGDEENAKAIVSRLMEDSCKIELAGKDRRIA